MQSKKSGPGNPRRVTIPAPATSDARVVRATDRTVAIAAALTDRQWPFDDGRAADMVGFFRAHPDFSFDRHQVESYLASAQPARRAAIRDSAVLRRDLLALERTIRLTDDYQQQAALIGRGLDAATKIARRSREVFVRDLGADPGVGPEAARLIHARATRTAAVALQLAGLHVDSGLAPAAVPAVAHSSDAAGGVPNLSTLFGSLNDTARDPCLSLLSPAAYLVDLLQFLADLRLPSLQISAPDEGAELEYYASQNFGVLDVEGVCDVAGMADAWIELSSSTPYDQLPNVMPAKASFAGIIQLPPGVQVVTASLKRGRDVTDVVASDSRTVNVVPMEVSGELIDVEPPPGQVTILQNESAYNFVASGSYTVSGVTDSSVVIEIFSSDGTSALVQRGSRAFSAMTYIQLGAADSSFTVRLSAVINGASRILKTVRHEITVRRADVSSSLTVVPPPPPIPGQIGQPATISFTGSFVFSGTGTFSIGLSYPDAPETPATITGQTYTGKLTYDASIGPTPVSVTATLYAGTRQSGSDVAKAIKSFTIGWPTQPAVAFAAVTSRTALSVLLERRPDLVDIELSCANSTTELPYVDLALEVLENAATHRLPLWLDLPAAAIAAFVDALDTATLPPAVAAALRGQLAPGLSAAATVDVVVAGSTWDIVEPGWRIGLERRADSLAVVRRVPQTAETASALASRSEHVDDRAYETLRRAGYPWSLPFDLPAEQARTYLGHLGSSRAELIEVFYRDPTPWPPEYGQLDGANFVSAAERRGFTVAEIDIISGARTGTGASGDPDSGLWNFWGFPDPELRKPHSIPDPQDPTRRISNTRWQPLLTGRIDVLLQQSGLSFHELRELLEMQYVNTDAKGGWVARLRLGTVPLAGGGGQREALSDDLSKASLVRIAPGVPVPAGADDPDLVALLDHMHRFTRLWRRLGCRMHELDQVLTAAPRPDGARWPVLDADFIGNFDRAAQIIQGRFGQPEPYLSFWLTHRYRDFAAPGQAWIPCLYERVFLDRSVAAEPPAAFLLNDARDELHDPTGLARDHLPHIAAGCGLSLQDASRILDSLGVDPPLNLGTLSTVFWTAMIVRRTNISTADFLQLLILRQSYGLSTLWDAPRSGTSGPPTERALRLQSSVGGVITSLRFLKAHYETGVHFGRIWSDAGELLAEARFEIETAEGWQETRLHPPLHIRANTDYRVSVNANSSFVHTQGGLSSTRVVHLKATGSFYGSVGAFPATAGGDENFYLDIGFVPDLTGPDSITLVDAVLSTGFSPAQVTWLLAHEQTAAESDTRTRATALLLTQLRAALATLADTAEGGAPPADANKALREEMAAAGWRGAVVDEVLALLAGGWAARLAALPAGLVLPSSAFPGIDFQNGMLTSATVLSTGDRTELAALSSDAGWTGAVAGLVDQFRRATEQAARDLAFAAPIDRSVRLDAWPTGLAVPAELAAWLFFDPVGKRLHFVGPMDDATYATLMKLEDPPAALSEAVKALRGQSASAPEPALALLDATAQTRLLSEIARPTERYEMLRTALRPKRVRKQAITIVRDLLQPALQLEAPLLERLLTQWLASAVGPEEGSAIEDLVDPDFVLSAASLPVTAERFPRAFKTITRLGKTALLASRFKLTLRSFSWLFGPIGAEAGWLDPNRLPASAIETALNFAPLLRLMRLMQLRDRLKGGEVVLDAVFTTAQDVTLPWGETLDRVCAATGWNLTDLTDLLSVDGFTFATEAKRRTALRTEGFLLRLHVCFELIGRIGASAAQCLAWSLPDDIGSRAAADIKRLARAKQSEADWRAVAPALQDGLRERQRAALVAWLIGSLQLRDGADLHERFLIDPEVGPAVISSRIKQAAASVQLFVQRCLLNLEPEVPGTLVNAQQWSWMKNFRVWEANRKIFLYPENWIVPELRDDKSEFYRQLESSLLQDELSADVALEAFKVYAERLGEVARLKTVAMCDDALADGRRTVHVLGRDGGVPHRYYYRKWRIPFGSDAGRWTAWEEVSCGIDSDHVLMFRYAGAVHIAWPTIRADVTSPQATIVMNVVRRRRTGWSAPKRGQGELAWTPPPNIDDSRGLVFRVVDDAFEGELRITCDGAVLDEGLLTQTRPLEYTVTARDKDGAQIAAFDLKPLLRYLDSRGRTYYWVVTDVPMVFIGLNLNPIAIGSRAFNGELKQTIALGEFLGQPGISYMYLDHSVNVYDSGKRYKPFAYTSKYDVNTLAAFSLAGDVVLDVKPDCEFTPKERDRFSPDRVIAKRQHVGHFRLDSKGAFTATTAVRPAATIVPVVRDSDSYHSNFREISPGGELHFDKPSSPKPVLPSVADRFEVTQQLFKSGTPTLAVAYSDRDLDLVIRTNAPLTGSATTAPPFAIVPAGCGWAETLQGTLGRNDLPGTMRIQTTARGTLQVGDAVDAPRSILQTGVTFDAGAPWEIYGWETFFHLPIAVAIQLSSNQKFEDAQRWFHLVFDPTAGIRAINAVSYWRFAPFAKAAQGRSIEVELLELAAGGSQLGELIAAWRAEPFSPHLIARVRPRAYQLFVVMRYIDNLVAWGDSLFRRGTIESLNEATQLYLLAQGILGRRPQKVSTDGKSGIRTYRLLAPSLDDFSNALVELESWIRLDGDGANGPGTDAVPTNIFSLYFSVPANDKLGTYWTTIDDRLYNIRHSLDIEGTPRRVPLYEAEIDPALLVRAAASGVSIDSVLAEVDGALPGYRFGPMLARATELCNDVKTFGTTLLSILERQDGEALALLRSTQEASLANRVLSVRQTQLDEGRANLEALRKTRDIGAQRYLQYQRLMGRPDLGLPAEGEKVALESTPAKALAVAGGDGDVAGLGLSQSESDHLGWLNVSNNYTVVSGGFRTAASVLHALPEVVTTPLGIGTHWGGKHWGPAASAVGDFFQTLAGNASYQGNRSATIGGHQRRFDDWAFQSNLAAGELEQIDRQIVAAEMRIAIAEKELANHKMQIADAREVNEFMREKFTHVDLYRWMRGQCAALHFSAYQAAYAFARRAEKCYRFELGLTDGAANVIRPGHWDCLRQGLLAGEMLAADLKRLDAAYLDTNSRELEITKHVSLRQLDGTALLSLRATGSCTFEVPEALFDLDFPGHYLRRLRSVTVSVPCVVGPYTSLSGTLRLLDSRVRASSSIGGGYDAAAHCRSTWVPVESIATSTAQADSGMFELNFRDDRYLPFEGAGAVSHWQFTLPEEFRAFDYATISDLVLTLRYSARDGGVALAEAARTSLRDRLNAIARDQSQAGPLTLLSLRQDFPVEWRAARERPEQNVKLTLAESLFPFMFRGRVEIRSATFCWSGVNTSGRPSVISQAGTLDLSQANMPRTLVLPKAVVEATDDPWLILRYGLTER